MWGGGYNDGNFFGGQGKEVRIVFSIMEGGF